jgi:hypothetical protein
VVKPFDLEDLIDMVEDVVAPLRRSDVRRLA